MTSQFSLIPDAVFLDRDGTIIYDKHYLCQPEGVELLPGAGQALKKLSDAGCRLFVVTNQSGIGRGLFTQKQYLSVEQRLDDLLDDYGVKLTATRFCPHAPQAEGDAAQTACACRKPGTGMWRGLQDAYGLDPGRCVMAGDKMADILFGINAGFAASFLVMTGQGRETAGKRGIPVPGDGVVLPFSLTEEKSEDRSHDRTRLYAVRGITAMADFLGR